MLTKEDLEAIGQLMDVKLVQQKQEIMGETKELMAQQETRILDESTRRMNILIENVVTPQFKLLAEGQQAILEKMATKEDIELLESRIDTLELVVKKHSREIADLKKAN